MFRPELFVFCFESRPSLICYFSDLISLLLKLCITAMIVHVSRSLMMSEEKEE